MADIKISQLGAAATISDSDVFPMTANGTTVKAAASLIKEYAIGDDDISALGDGSPTGAILALNADKSAKTDIAMIEASVATAAHAIGAEFYLSGVLMRATAAIAVGDQIVNGTNCAPADDVSSQIQALTNKVGNGTPTTTDQTIIGAINELDSDIDDINAKSIHFESQTALTPNAVNTIYPPEDGFLIINGVKVPSNYDLYIQHVLDSTTRSYVLAPSTASGFINFTLPVTKNDAVIINAYGTSGTYTWLSYKKI